jgi:hypothetical protein
MMLFMNLMMMMAFFFLVSVLPGILPRRLLLALQTMLRMT